MRAHLDFQKIHTEFRKIIGRIIKNDIHELHKPKF